jgi:3-hydroxybutyryl-CoA dehydrogenase
MPSAAGFAKKSGPNNMKIVLIAANSFETTGRSAAIFPASSCTVVRVEEVPDPDLHPDADLFVDLDFAMEPSRIGKLSKLLQATVMIHSVVYTLREVNRPFVRINAWPGFLERSIHELVVPDPATELRIGQLYQDLGCSYRTVPDVPGMISARIVATIINEAFFTLQDKVSTREEIDTAMKLGTNYPLGPFEWSERIGLSNVLHLLSVLSKTEERYKPADELVLSLNRIKI